MAARKTFFVLAVLCGLCGSASAAERKELIHEMALFDKALIPAYFATRDVGQDAAPDALTELARAWGSFQSSMEAAALSDAEWPDESKRVDELVDRAARRAADEGGMPDAHDAVSEIRNVLMALRQRNEVDYLPDMIVEFERCLAGTIEALAAKRSDAARETYAVCRGLWEQISAFRLDKVVYGLDYYALGELALHGASTGEALTGVDEALGADDGAAALARAREAREHATHYYEIFGQSKAF